MPITLFLSFVSREFHHKDPKQPQAFESYRDFLTRCLRKHLPGCSIIVQEELVQGMGDLLQTLDDVVKRSDVVIHVVGDWAGAKPEQAELRRLSERHLKFLQHEPELANAIPNREEITYTQWEAYLAYEHQRNQLVFVADKAAPRSPLFTPSESEKASQARHLKRLELVAKHRQPCYSQSDLARAAIIAIERNGLNPATKKEPSREAFENARKCASSILEQVGQANRQSAKTAVTDYDLEGVATEARQRAAVV